MPSWKPKTPEEQNATGVMIGSGIGGVDGIADTAPLSVKEQGPRRMSPVLHSRAASSISPPAMSRSSSA